MKTIAIIQQKGDVGKSTTALAIGEGLAQKDYAVLYVDFDEQGPLTFVMGSDTNRPIALGVIQKRERQPKYSTQCKVIS